MAFVLVEFDCAECGRFESLEERATVPDAKACPECGARSPWCISAPKVKTKWGTAQTGGSAERPAHALDTRALADGQPLGDWRAARRTARRKERLMTMPKSVRDKVQA